jgi:hypothetical protein
MFPESIPEWDAFFPQTRNDNVSMAFIVIISFLDVAGLASLSIAKVRYACTYLCRNLGTTHLYTEYLDVQSFLCVLFDQYFGLERSWIVSTW